MQVYLCVVNIWQVNEASETLSGIYKFKRIYMRICVYIAWALD